MITASAASAHEEREWATRLPGGDDARKEADEAEERWAPNGRVVYKAILTEGESELERSSAALFWSGLAAGLSMSLSMFGEGLLMSHLPDVPWRPSISKLGYSFGFVAVVLGRQQLFTENTLTPILSGRRLAASASSQRRSAAATLSAPSSTTLPAVAAATRSK